MEMSRIASSFFGMNGRDESVGLDESLNRLHSLLRESIGV